MKKKYTFISILIILIFGLQDSFAQCTPMFNDGCSIALHSFGLSFSPTSTMLIEDTETACSGPSSSGVINVTAGYTYNFDLNVFSAAGSDNTSAFFSIFLDKNNDGDFEDAGERLYYNNSTEIFKSGFGSPDFFSDAITIPADATTGVDLKFRVLVVAANDLGGGCNTDPSDACGTYCGGEIHDYTLNIAPVPICPLIFINGCSIALHDFSLASVTPAVTLINNIETSCSGPEGNPIINVKAGENYNFDLTVYSAGGSDNVSAFFSIWLDKNNDGDFADTGERLYYNNTTEIYKSGYGPPENASGSITIPTDALTGTDLKFRVLVVAANDLGDGCNTDPNNACGLYCGGEVHDYLFNIAPPDCITPNTPTVSDVTACAGSNVTLTATCSTGTPSWYDSSTTITALNGGSLTINNVTAPGVTYYVACETSVTCASNRVTQSTIVTDIPNPPTATGQTICNGTTASLTANCTTGTAKWYESNTSTTILGTGTYTTPNLTSSTTYYVACESGGVPNCVSARTAQMVTVNDLPSPPTATGQTICNGTTASLTANCTTGTAKWYESNTSTTVLGTGTYTTPNLTNSTTYFVACESGGVLNCVSARTAQIVTVNDLPTPPTATGQTICNGSTASLTANCTTGTAKWYESNTSTTVLGTGNYTTPSLTTATTYFVSCESGGSPNCVSSRTTHTVNINPLPIKPVISANKTSLCNGETATLSATGCNGSIRWNTAVTGSSLTISLAGTYSAVCINNCGTSLSSNMVIITTGSAPYPPVISSDKTMMCDGEKATLTVSGCNGKILWNTGASTSNIELRVAGTYGATCEVYCGTSAISNIITLRTGQTPTTPTIALSAPILCGETTKTLIATGCNGQIRWSTNSTGSTLNVTTAGTYTAVCETICGVSPRGNILNVQFLPNPTPTATNTGPYEISQKIQLSATGGNTYLWRGPNDFISTNANVSVLNAALDDRGVYTVTVTNTNGCTATATSNVVVNPCSQMFKYDYVKAGTNFEYLFPITDGMTINAMSINTGIIATPICQLDTVNTPSVRIQMTGPEPLYNRDIIENIYPYSPFENRWFQIFGPIFPVGEYTLTITGYSQEYAQGNVMFGPQTIHFTIVGNSTSIVMAQNNISEICAGSSFDVSFETTGDFLSGNAFEVQLSNANGSFEVPIKIGESSNAGIVNCQIPTNIPAGNGYKTRVFATKPAQMSNSSSLGFKINPRNISLQSPNDDISALINKKAGEKITAVNKVQTGGNATYQAGRSINLEAGFSVSSGAVFKAEIGACN